MRTLAVRWRDSETISRVHCAMLPSVVRSRSGLRRAGSHRCCNGRMESREDTPLRDQALIFLHLPKCGGTTLNRIIEWEYNPLRIFSVDPSFFRWSYQKLKRLSPQRLSAFRVFKGHMPFGIHQRLTHPATYITVMRDPIDRAISEYYFALNYRLQPEHRMMQQLSLDHY